MPPYLICDLPLYHSFSTTTMSKSLSNSLLVTLKKGNTKFKCSDPLQSFTLMTSKLPTPHSVCIRSVHCLYGSLCSMFLSLPFLHPPYSGSTCVQAIVGSQWDESDLDIYCTSESAPFVRSWLLGKEVNQIFGGYSEVSKFFN